MNTLVAGGCSGSDEAQADQPGHEGEEDGYCEPNAKHQYRRRLGIILTSHVYVADLAVLQGWKAADFPVSLRPP
jgi:hypothetical protein